MRTFIAIDMPEWVGEKVSWIQEKIGGRGIKHVERENLHITIAFLGEKTIPEIEEIKHSLAFLSSFSPVKAKLHGVSFFPSGGRPRVVFVDVHSKQLKELGETIRMKLGIEEEFRPHLTISRIKGYVENGLMQRLESLRDFYVGEIEISEVKLKKSILLPTHPVYSDVFSWKLQK